MPKTTLNWWYEASNIHCYNQSCSCTGGIGIWVFSCICTLLFIRRGGSAEELEFRKELFQWGVIAQLFPVLASVSAKYFLWTLWYYEEWKGWLQRAHHQLLLEFRIWEDRNGKMMQDLSYFIPPFWLHRTASIPCLQSLALTKPKCAKWWLCTPLHRETVSWRLNLTSSHDCPSSNNTLFCSAHTPYIFAHLLSPVCTSQEEVTLAIPVSSFCFFLLSLLSWQISRQPTGKAVIC